MFEGQKEFPENLCGWSRVSERKLPRVGLGEMGAISCFVVFVFIILEMGTSWKILSGGYMFRGEELGLS